MMNEVQAVKFWNAIAQGEVIGELLDTEYCQGGPITKPTYTSAICDFHGLNPILVPMVRYSPVTYDARTDTPNNEECKAIAEFLRSVADSIESASSVNLVPESEQCEGNAPTGNISQQMPQIDPQF